MAFLRAFYNLRCKLNTYLTVLIAYLIFILLFPGGIVYYIGEKIYITFFDILIRSKVSDNVEVTDWENPTLTERLRKQIRSGNMFSFISIEELTSYWTKRKDSLVSFNEKLTNRFNLCCHVGTASAGCNIATDSLSLWDFLLVANPNECPNGWSSFEYNINNAQQMWVKVDLPNHWQLQGFDIPLYTNTTYPFPIDPPRVRRNGDYQLAPCDVGLGYAKIEYGRHSNEPGENACGLFRKTFTLPDAWCTGFVNEDIIQYCDNENITLVLEGVDSCTSVWVNGIYVGYSQDSALSCSFDVTAALKSNNLSSGATNQSSKNNWKTAEHVIAVQVLRWCDGSYLEDQDKWWLSGIYRDVYLRRETLSNYISDIQIKTSVNHNPDVSLNINQVYNTANADICVDILVESTESSVQDLQLKVEIWNDVPGNSSDPAHQAILTIESKLSSHQKLANGSKFLESIAADEFILPTKDSLHFMTPSMLSKSATSYQVSLSGLLNNAPLWTPENPQLLYIVIYLTSSKSTSHKLDLGITDPNKKNSLLCIQSSKFGVRDIDVGGKLNQLRVNQRPVTICGMNRMEFDSKTGRAVSVDSMIRDAILLKKLNFNAVRCSHCPPHPIWLEICDEVGLYVIDEANIETHGFQVIGQPVGYLSHCKDWEKSLVERVTRMYERDKNHPCIIGWSLGNESGYGPSHQKMYQWLKHRDPSRFVQYESGGARTTATDIICPMYARPDWCVNHSINDIHRRPVILCEYAHAMGNSGGCLADYWSVFRDKKYPRMQGGFVWDWADQGLDLQYHKRRRRWSNDGSLHTDEAVSKNFVNPQYMYGGDFQESPHTGDFCCNGILNPDRSPYPVTMELKFLQCPVAVSIQNDEGSSRWEINIENRRSFSDLSDCTVTVQLCIQTALFANEERGPKKIFHLGQAFVQQVDIGDEEYSLNIPPSSNVSIDLTDYIENATETILSQTKYIASAFQKDFSRWLHVAVESSNALFHSTQNMISNHKVSAAVDQVSSSPFLTNSQETVDIMKCMVLLDTTFELPPISRLSVNQSDHSIMSHFQMTYKIEESHRVDNLNIKMTETIVQKIIRIAWGNGAEAIVGMNCGRIVSWNPRRQDGVTDNIDMIMDPIDICLFRAGTPNDKGGGDISYYNRWKTDGLDRLRVKSAEIISIHQINENEPVVVQTKGCLAPFELNSHCFDANSFVEINYKCDYIFHCNGSIELKYTITPSNLLAPLPRLGIKFSIPKRLDKVKYFGFGPYESYDDRKSCANLGVFEMNVDGVSLKLSDSHTSYMVPQENGRRAGPRWILWSNGSYPGLGIIPNSFPGRNNSWGFSTSKYSLNELDEAKHQYELLEDNKQSTAMSDELSNNEKMIGMDQIEANDKLYVHVDQYMMGVGGYDSWTPNVMEQYLEYSNGVKYYQMNIVLVPFI